MAFMVWKDRNGTCGWGCADCEFMIRNPRMHESLGEYVAAIRTLFDQHHCDKKERRNVLQLVKKPTPRSLGRLSVRMPLFS